MSLLSAQKSRGDDKQLCQENPSFAPKLILGRFQMV